jgi:RNA ligase (TIGR02306 family)
MRRSFRPASVQSGMADTLITPDPNDIRALARVVNVDRITPIEGADSIEVAHVGLWRVVVGIEEFTAGAKAVFFELDSFLPFTNPAFDNLLRKRKTTVFTVENGTEDGLTVEGHVLSSAKLRGVTSQGLLMTLEKLGLDAELPVGENVTARLAVLKVEEVDDETTTSGNQAGKFPSNVVSKTDSERIQNPDIQARWEEIRGCGDFRATEKIDGRSFTAARGADGSLFACSRNFKIKEGEGIEWTILNRYNLGELLGDGDAIQGEIYGPGIQGNKLRLTGEIRLAVFNVTRSGHPIAFEEWPERLKPHAVPLIPELSGKLPENPADLLEAVNGRKSVINSNVLAEGVVFSTVDGEDVPGLGRSTFKAISNAWLLKFDSRK